MRLEVGEIAIDLTDEQAEDLRRQLNVERSGDKLIDATEAARRLGVSRAHIYRHKHQYGAIRLGDGPMARLRFDPARIFSPTPKAPKPARQKPRRRRSTEPPLLEVRGPGPYAPPTNNAAPGSAQTPTEGLTTGGMRSDG